MFIVRIPPPPVAKGAFSFLMQTCNNLLQPFIFVYFKISHIHVCTVSWRPANGCSYVKQRRALRKK